MSTRAAVLITGAIIMAWIAIVGTGLAAVWTNVDNDLSAKWGLSTLVLVLAGVGGGGLAGLGIYSAWGSRGAR